MRPQDRLAAVQLGGNPHLESNRNPASRMNQLSLMVDFVARVHDLTGNAPSEDDLQIFNSPGWVHIIQTNPQNERQNRTGWCTYRTLGKHLHRMLAEKWPG